jgi:hypothetical protein
MKTLLPRWVFFVEKEKETGKKKERNRKVANSTGRRPEW